MDTQAFAAHATRYAEHVFCCKCAHTCTVAANYLRMDRQVSEWSGGCECQASGPAQFAVQHLACVHFHRAWLRAFGRVDWPYWKARNARRDDRERSGWRLILRFAPAACQADVLTSTWHWPDNDLISSSRDIQECGPKWIEQTLTEHLCSSLLYP